MFYNILLILSFEICIYETLKKFSLNYSYVLYIINKNHFKYVFEFI